MVSNRDRSLSEPLVYDLLPDSTSIRLLTLHPGNSSLPVKASLEVIPLPSAFSYEALSYVWGSQAPTTTIKLQNQPFTIGPNLHSALIRLRHRSQPRILWIDALCINQADLAERAAQVSLMRSIYAGAASVLIWMGPDPALERDAASAYYLAKAIADTLRRFLLAGGEDLHLASAERRKAVREALEASQGWAINFAGTRRWLGSAWFGRVWTFQEAFLAREARVLCGALVELDLLAFTAMWSSMLRMGIRPDLKGIECSRVLMATLEWEMRIRLGAEPPPKHEHRLRLSTLLKSTYQHEASDDRDRIFGLLAMTQPVGDRLFVPDYSATVEEVYTRAAKALIGDDGTLQILSDAQREGGAARLPSWVPDWRLKSSTRALAERTRDFDWSFNVNKGFIPSEVLLPCENPKRLRLRGARLGRIAKVACDLGNLVAELHPTRIDVNNWREKMALPGQLLQEAGVTDSRLPLASYVPTGETLVTAAIRTLAADELPCSTRLEKYAREYYPRYAEYDALSWREAVPSLATSGVHGERDLDASGAPAREVVDLLFSRKPIQRWDLDPFRQYEFLFEIETVYLEIARDLARAIETHAAARAIVITEGGHLGLAPHWVDEGDEIMVLAGGDVPFALRRTSPKSGHTEAGAIKENDGEEFQLVGDCYIHGIMDGELWRESKDSNGQVVGLVSADGSLQFNIIALM